MSRETINLQTALHKDIRSEEVNSSFVQVRKIINQSNDERFWCGCLHISFVLFLLQELMVLRGKPPLLYRRNYVLIMNDTTQIFDRQGTFCEFLASANYC